MPDVFESITQFMREHYEPKSSAELEEEAKYMKNQLRKQAAGRVICGSSDEEAETLIEQIKKEYEANKEFYRIERPACRPPFRPR